MWEIEGLTELAVQCVGRTSLDARERRSFLANLYELHDQYDCSYTHFRCFELLSRSGFLHRLDLSQLEGFAPEAVNDGQWLTRDSEGREIIGIYRDATAERAAGVYIDARSSVWPDLRARGLEPKPDIDFDTWRATTTFARVMKLAAAEGDVSVLSGYYGFAAQHLAFLPDPPAPGDPELAEARALPQLVLAVQSPKDNWIDERFPMPPAPEMLEHLSEPACTFIEWWTGPLKA